MDRPKADTIRGYKGFDSDLKCRGFQYEVGTRVEHTGDIKLCTAGLHFCLHPLDVLTYYHPANGGRFAEVAAETVSDETHHDSKRVSKVLTVRTELTFRDLINAGVRYALDLTKRSAASCTTQGYSAHSTTQGDYAHSTTQGYSAHSTTQGYHAHCTTQGDSAHSTTQGDFAHSTTQGDSAHSTTQGDYAHSTTQGDYAHSTTQGYSAHSTTQGDSAHSTTQGYHAHSTTQGKESIAAGLGRQNWARAAKGSWIVLAEWMQKQDGAWAVRSVQSIKVDGKKIKADTFYELRDGKFVEAK